MATGRLAVSGDKQKIRRTGDQKKKTSDLLVF